MTLADMLEQAGFRAFADGFLGVSFNWRDAADQAPDPDAVAAELPAALPSPDALAASGGLAAIVEHRVQAAVAAGDARVKLDPSELDRLLDGTGLGYGDVTDALEQAGFRAFADGFTGVSVRWSDDD